MQTQISKPTDLELHFLQRQDISGFSRTRVKLVLHDRSLVLNSDAAQSSFDVNKYVRTDIESPLNWKSFSAFLKDDHSRKT